MTISKEEKEYFRNCFSQIPIKNNFNDIIYELYVIHKYSYRNIVTIVNHVFRKINIQIIIKILEEFDVKRCNKGEDCKSPNGCIQSRSNFNKDNTTIDRKQYICSYCYNYNRNFRRADQTKQNHILEFQKIKEKIKQDEFLVNLYKQEGFTYNDLSTISLRKINNIINLLQKYDIKRCSNSLCKTPIQSRKNFFVDNTSIDGLMSQCRVCQLQYSKIYNLVNLEIIRNKHKEYNDQFGRYNTYASKLNFYGEKVRRDLNNQKLIQVQCKLCKKWFNPTNLQIQNRIRAIDGQAGSVGTECNFYCSQECKELCPLYRIRVSELITQQRLKNNNLNQEDFERMTQELRRYFLKLKNPDRCELCGEKFDQKNLILHHIIPVSIDYISEADKDNIIFICKNCHNQVHQIDGCQNNQLKEFSLENKSCF